MTSAVDRSGPPPAGAPRPVPELQFERRTLANGLVLAAAPRHRVPLVELELLLPAGGDRNPADRPGLSQLTASLLDEGTELRSGRELSAALERRGGGLGTGSDWSAASIHLSLPAAELDFGLELLAELLLRPAFPDAEVERLRRQSLAEIARRVDRPDALADEEFARRLYAGSVYAEPLLGTDAALRAVARHEVVDFHRDRCRIGGARLVVAGDLAMEKVAARAEELFPPDSTAEVAAPEIRAATPSGVEVVVVDRPDASQTELRVGHVGVARNHPDRTGLGFLNSLLGGKFTSRINLNLRERLGITYGAFSRFADRRSPGPFVVGCAVENAAVGVGATEIRRELERLRDEEVSSQELEETRSYLLGVFPYGLQTIEGLAARLRDIARYDLPLDQAERAIAQYRAMTAGELRRLAQAHLDPERCLVVAAGPAAEIAPQLEALGTVIVTRPEPVGDGR